MGFCYLPVFAYSVGVGLNPDLSTGSVGYIDSIIGLVVVTLNSMFILVLRTLAQHLQNPFGVEAEDLCVLHYIRNTILMSRKILCALNVDKVCPALEKQLIDTRERRCGETEKVCMCALHIRCKCYIILCAIHLLYFSRCPSRTCRTPRPPPPSTRSPSCTRTCPCTCPSARRRAMARAGSRYALSVGTARDILLEFTCLYVLIHLYIHM